MIKISSIILLSIFLTGCSTTYTLDGQKYESPAAFQNAVESQRLSAIGSVKKLPAPLNPKKLIAALPSEQTLYEENIRRITKNNGTAPTGVTLELIVNLTKSNYKLTRVFYEAVQARGIYSEVEIREMPSMAISLEPSKDYDVIYYTEPAQNTGQYFFTSTKHGKQIFAFDRSVVGIEAKTNSFIEAVQAQAIKQ